MDSDPKTRPSFSRVFNRLRRVPVVEELEVKKTNNIEKVFYDNNDDEIEEFSPYEDLIRGKYNLLRIFKAFLFF